jgi:SAM-dependent methyltransferase
MITVFYVCALLAILSFAYAAGSAAPWLPSRRRDRERLLSLAGLHAGERFYDLGCGDGRIVALAAESGLRATGFEVAIIPYLLALWRTRNTPTADIRYKNFWSVSLADADVVYIFLTERIYPRLEQKLATELKPGARVICYAWPLPTWKTEVALPSTADNLPLFLYRR